MTASENIDKQIRDLSNWRGQMITQIRELIREADPSIKEDWKWGTGVWVQNGLVCAVGAFKDHIKINFFKGASIPDPKGLFNAGLDAKTSRSINLVEGDLIDHLALKNLILAAVAFNNKK